MPLIHTYILLIIIHTYIHTFCSLLVFFLAPAGLGKIVRNSQNIRTYYMLNHRIRCIYCDTNCYSGRSKNAWALAVSRWKNFQNHVYGQPVLTFTVLAVASVWMNINRVTLQHNRGIYYVYFLFWNGLTRDILSNLGSVVYWTTENNRQND